MTMESESRINFKQYFGLFKNNSLGCFINNILGYLKVRITNKFYLEHLNLTNYIFVQ